MLTWRSFIRIFCWAAMLFAGALYLFILLVDPYDNVPFSPPLKREPISTNQRFSYPSLARNPSFDSAIIGTSTLRLLNPQRLNALTSNSWVNLAMNSATAYEQMEMLNLFLKNHPTAKYVVLGIDDAWCRPGTEIQEFTFRPFPPWMYDGYRWNDLLYLFNDKALENSVRMIEYWVGKREAKYDAAGFTDFTKDFGEYNLEKTKALLYPNGVSEDLPIEPRLARKKQQEFASHRLLVEGWPKGTTARLILVQVPLHADYQRRSRDIISGCKQSIATGIQRGLAMQVIDMMQINSMTVDDSNYWDSLHYRRNVAENIMRRISGVISDEEW